VRGSLEAHDGIAFYMNGPRIDAAVALNRPKEIRLAMPLIRRRVEVDPDALQDPDVDLRKLASG